MKKKVLFIIFGVILAIGIGVGILFMTLNKTKSPITSTEFKTTMEAKDYVVVDATSQFSEYSYIKQVYVAAPNDYSYKIEFYELSDESYAVNFYNNNRSVFESKKGNLRSETSISINNYSKYSLSTNGNFQVVSRIDNTVVYLDVKSNYKGTVKDILKELGY